MQTVLLVVITVYVENVLLDTALLPQDLAQVVHLCFQIAIFVLIPITDLSVQNVHLVSFLIQQILNVSNVSNHVSNALKHQQIAQNAHNPNSTTSMDRHLETANYAINNFHSVSNAIFWVTLVKSAIQQ